MTPSSTAWPPTLKAGTIGGGAIDDEDSTTMTFPPQAARRANLSARAGLRLGRLLVLAAEFLDATRGVDELLLTREVRVAIGTDLDVNLVHDRARLDDVATDADDAGVDVARVDSGPH